MNLVQVVSDGQRRVGVVDDSRLRFLAGYTSTYALASDAIARSESIAAAVNRAAGDETTGYDAIYEGQSTWRLLPSFDHPDDAAHCLVTGTGLTHKASAENRAAMHKQQQTGITDSARMYQMGLEGGTPGAGHIGVQPEWFYKGDGSVLRGHGEALSIPPFAGDGGEEPEIAGAYLISPSGQPYRVGLTMANEFSDHVMEKQNYLYLAPSKLRNCSLGPELLVGDIPFEDVRGTVSIYRDGNTVWSKQIWTGQKNMSHSVANLEHHHFKYDAHRRSGDVHIHFFGADAFSFGEGVQLAAGDVMEVAFNSFGRPLRNTLQRSAATDSFVPVRIL